jgi:hypothetical protein
MKITGPLSFKLGPKWRVEGLVYWNYCSPQYTPELLGVQSSICQMTVKVAIGQTIQFRMHATQPRPIPWPSFIGITLWRHLLHILSLVPHCLVNMSKSMLITHCHFSVICWKHCFEFLENAWSKVDTATTLHLRGTVQQHELLILIYSESSHIFISDKWQPRLLGVQPLDHRLAVKVANGQSVSCPHHLPDVGCFISDYQIHHLPDAEWFISSYQFVNDRVFLQLRVVYVTVVREVLLRPSDTKQVHDNGLMQQLRSSNNDLKYAVKDSFHNNNQFLVSMSSNEQASLSQSAWHLPNTIGSLFLAPTMLLAVIAEEGFRKLGTGLGSVSGQGNVSIFVWDPGDTHCPL